MMSLPTTLDDDAMTGVPVPESRDRKKANYTPPPAKAAGPRPSPPWYAPVMVALFVIGLALVLAARLK